MLGSLDFMFAQLVLCGGAEKRSKTRFLVLRYRQFSWSESSSMPSDTIHVHTGAHTQHEAVSR